MRFLRQNTAIRITVGPFLDKTDGITPEVALTATNEHLTLMVDDGNVPTLVLDANATGSGGSNDMVHVTNDDAGFYDLELTAAQLNYVGRAMLSINYVTDHCPVFHELMIIPAQVYDSLILGTDALQVHANEITNDLITAAAIAAGAIDNAAFAADVGSTAIGTNVIGIAAKKGVVDALNVDTYAEPGQGAPPATATFVQKLGYLYKAFRNKITQTASTLSIYNDAGSVVDQKAAVSDDATTFSRDEIASGP